MTTHAPYICLACGDALDAYSPKCSTCQAAETVIRNPRGHITEEKTTRNRAQNAAQISTQLPKPIRTGRDAWDKALGGGFVKPSSVLIHGPAGVGKSTSALRIAVQVAKSMGRKALYGSAEMPKEHLRLMADKVRIAAVDLKHLYVNDSGNFEDMLEDVVQLKPVIIVWDSIQRFRVDEELGEVELRKVTTGAIELGNSVKAVTLLLSQVTKDDAFIGSNAMGHDADVVLSLRKVGPNLIAVECLVKNRWGPTPLSATEALY